MVGQVLGHGDDKGGKHVRERMGGRHFLCDRSVQHKLQGKQLHSSMTPAVLVQHTTGWSTQPAAPAGVLDCNVSVCWRFQALPP